MRYLYGAGNPVEEQLRKAEYIALFLDYDGTLAPIASRPAKAGMDRETAALLRMLKNDRRITLGIISGRTLVDIKQRIRLPGIYYAGNHGLELETPEKERLVPGTRIVASMQELAKALAPAVREIKGALLENKNSSLSVHYRMVAPRDVPRLRRSVFRILRSRSRTFDIGRGKKVWDIRPARARDKGKAVTWILDHSESGHRALPVYIGDDLTDENAFRALRGRGITVRVCRKKSSAAGYYVTGVSEVKQCLKQLLQS